MKAGIDRRVCMVKVSAEKKGDQKYFSDLMSFLNQETADHFFTYLLQKVSLGSYNPETFPKGEAHLQLLYDSLPVTERYLKGIEIGSVPWPAQSKEVYLPILKQEISKQKLLKLVC